jgi:hypothetical protein
MYEGEYHVIPVSVVDANAVAVNLTGATLTWRLCADNATGTVILTKTLGSGIAVISAALGTLEITLEEANTVDRGGASYYHELVIDDSAGHSEVGFVGRISIKKSAIL